MEMKMIKQMLTLMCFSLIALILSGCAGSTASKSEAPPADPAPSKATTAIYYEFEDVLVPKDLAIVQNSTVVVSTPGYTSGILTLKGRVDKLSLFNFFNINMLKDNWSMVSQIKSPASMIMVFQKQSRWAVITIREQAYYTYVEIGVAPTVGNPPSASSSKLFD